MLHDQPHSPIQDARVNAVIERMQATRSRPPGRAAMPPPAAIRRLTPSRAFRSIPSRAS